ncbi:MAG: BlaI/MecI/CopY family transcriptional regulator [Acidobacteriota bacterium]
MKKKTAALSPLENQLMQLIWERGSSTAEQVRQALQPDRPLKESTVRTLLRRMEEKGFLNHRVEGRTYVYRPAVPPQKAAARAVRQIVDRFCGGSVEALLVGMVDDELLDGDELQRLADKLSREGGEEE